MLHEANQYVILSTTKQPKQNELSVSQINATSQPTTNVIIQATEQWINTVIIKYNFCPFARKEMNENSIRYVVKPSSSIDHIIDATLQECQYLDATPQTATTLVILPQGFDNFERYLDLIELVQSQIIDPDYQGIYQLASFHPLYCFADSDPQDAANYTNRSPYPTLHLIRESSISAALADYPDSEQIPQRNIALARRKGQDNMAQLLAQCQTIKHDEFNK